MNTVINKKQALRQQMIALLKNLPSHEKMEAGQAIRDHIAHSIENDWRRNIVSIALFASFADEIATTPLDDFFRKMGVMRHLLFCDEKNQLCFIRLDDNESISALGTWPLDVTRIKKTHTVCNISTDLDLIFVPGLAFNQAGHRLGRGKGYYDRVLKKFLAEGKERPFFIGLAMDKQLLLEIPLENHDVPMDYLCTPALGLLQVSS
jgi:5-formyltetrahydrofolate cyclo-ligase